MKTDRLNEQRFLADMALSYKACRHCHVADVDRRIARFGNKCRVCGLETDGASSFFDLNIALMLDLLQESFRAALRIKNDPQSLSTTAVHAQYSSTVIFFRAIKEALLERFVTNYFSVFRVPVSLSKRLLNEFDTDSRRRDILFPALTSLKWKQAITLLTSKNLDFSKLNKFLKTETDERNKLLHEADHFRIDFDLAKDCLTNLELLLQMFVGLHNKFVHPWWMEILQRVRAIRSAG